MEKLKSTITIEVFDIKVEDGYYSFKWNATVDGKKKKGAYDSDYEGWTERAWEAELKKGEALNRALEQLINL